MAVVKRSAGKRKAAVKCAAVSCEPSQIWQSVGLMIMCSILCGGALSALSFLSFVPSDFSSRFLTQVYGVYALPGQTVNRIAKGEKISDDNIFGLLQIIGDSRIGQVAGAVEEK